jgi:hypothetical protein
MGYAGHRKADKSNLMGFDCHVTVTVVVEKCCKMANKR